MAPLGLTVRPDGEWMIIHRRPSCGRVGANRIAGDDNALILLRMALRPLTGDRLRAGLRLSV